MNKDVLNKLAKLESKVELAEVKVELANINELVKVIESGERVYKAFNDAYAQLEKIKPVIIANGNQFAAILENAFSLQMTLKKQFQEIGLNWDDYPEAKALKSLLSKSQMLGKMTASVSNIM